MAYLESFTIPNCDCLAVNYYLKGQHSPSVQKTITAEKEINQILAFMASLPEGNGIMMSMAPVPIIRLDFYLNEKIIGFIEFYDDRLKLVDTSFAPSQSNEEKALYIQLKTVLKG